MFKKKSFERYKCLECATFYKRPTEEWVKLNEKLSKVKDPNLVNVDIECPKCKSKKFQHIPIVRVNYKEKVLKHFDVVTTFLGKICASVLSLFLFQYNSNASIAFEYILGFIFLVFAIKFANLYLLLDLNISCVLVMLFFIIKRIGK